MSDLERLTEALADYENAVHKSEVVWDQKSLVVAARAYRDLLANGERVWRCETHNTCGQDYGCRFGREDDCRMVSKLLIDPTTEEER